MALVLNYYLNHKETSLILGSQEIDNAKCTQSKCNYCTSDTVAPDGTTTADKVYPTTSGSSRQILFDICEFQMQLLIQVLYLLKLGENLG